MKHTYVFYMITYYFALHCPDLPFRNITSQFCLRWCFGISESDVYIQVLRTKNASNPFYQKQFISFPKLDNFDVFLFDIRYRISSLSCWMKIIKDLNIVTVWQIVTNQKSLFCISCFVVFHRIILKYVFSKHVIILYRSISFSFLLYLAISI